MKAPEPSETAIQAAVIEHWRLFGFPGSLVAAIPNANAHGQPGLTKGLPDLLVQDSYSPITFYLELKKESLRNAKNGGLSESQINFRDRCRVRGIPWEVAYGRDEPIQVLERWGIVRKKK